MNSTAVNAVIMVLTTILAKLLGFARELSLAFAYGAGGVSDAYVVAFSIPTILFSGIGTAMLTSYISVYTNLQTNRPGEEKRFHNNVITMSFLLSVLFVAVFLIFRYPVMRLFALGFKGEQLDLAVNLASIMILSLLFMGVGYILQGFLQMKGRFFAVGMVSVPLNLAVIATILTAGSHYDLLGWGLVLGYAGELVLVVLVARRCKCFYRPQLNLHNRSVRHFLSMVLPIFLGKTINSINTLIDKTIASLLSPGVVSVLNYGNRVTGFVTSVFVVSITTALFPQMSRLTAQSNLRQLKKTYVQSAGIISLFVIPISVGMMIFAKPLITLMFQRGAFTADDVQRTADVVVFYSIGLLFFSLKEVTINVFYALQDAKTPTINSIIAIVLNIVLNLALMRTMEHKGLALATSISGFVTLVFLLICLHKKMGKLGFKHLSWSIIKMIFSSAIMAFGTYPAYNLLLAKTGSMVTALLLAILIGAAFYFCGCVVFRVRELGEAVVAIANRLHRKRAGSAQ